MDAGEWEEMGGNAGHYTQHGGRSMVWFLRIIRI